LEEAAVFSALRLKDLGTAGAVALAIACATLGGSATAQEPTEAPACAAAKCLEASFPPALLAQLGEGGVTVEAVAEGLVLSYRGEEPIDVRLVAVRYDNGRLVRYGVSQRTRLEPGEGLTVEGADAAIARAFVPATHRVATVGLLDGADGHATDVVLPAFVGNVPPTFMVGEPGLIAFEGEQSGSIGIIALEPEDPALRDGMAAASRGALVRLTLTRP
jgi:hypothetical protein